MQNVHPLWLVCLIVRLSIYYYLSIYKSKQFRYIPLIMSATYLYQYINHKPSEKQIANVFWNKSRPIHALLMFLLFYFYNHKQSHHIFLLDILYSLVYRFN